MHPVGPRTPRIYWIRRVAVVVAAVAVLVGVIFVVAARSKGAAAGAANGSTSPSGSSTPTLTGVLASNSSVPSVALLPASSAATASLPPNAGALPSAAGALSSAPTTTGTTPTTAGATGTSGATGATPTTAGKAATTPPKITPSAGRTTTGSSATGVPGVSPTTGSRTTTATRPAGTGKPPAVTAPTTKTSTGVAPTSVTPTSVTPSTDAQGRLLCPDSALKLMATTGAPAYAVGDQVILGVSVTNTGAADCTRDLSGRLQVFSVWTAAGARVWSTADCFPGEGTDLRTLTAGQTVHYNIKWAGTTSTPGCATPRLPVPAGRYQVRVSIGSLMATPGVLVVG